MAFLETVLLCVLRGLEAVVGPVRRRLEDRREARELDRLCRSYGGFQPGQWVRILQVTCEKCQLRDDRMKAGDLVRVKRFTTEASDAGEWVFDKPATRFFCAPGLALEAVSAEQVAAELRYA